MKFTISFTELSKYIAEHYGKTLSFGRVSKNEVCVSYSQKMFFKTMQVPVNIIIDEVKDETICLTYKGSFGIDLIIAGALSFLKSIIPELANVVVTGEGHRLRIELSQLRQAKALVENIRLDEILVEEDGFEVKGALK